MENRDLKVALAAIGACLLWSTAFVGIKIGLRHSEPFFFAGCRFFLAGLLLIPFCGPFRKYITTVKKNFKTILSVAAVQTFILYTFFYTGISMATGALSAIIVGSSPLFAAILAHRFMRNDRMTPKKVGAILIGMIGITIISISKNPLALGHPYIFLGIILLIISNLSSAGGNIIVARAKQNVPPLILNSSQILIGGSGLMILSLFTEGIPKGDFPLEFYLSLGWLTMISAVAFSVWFTLLQKPYVKVSQLNVWKFIIPVLGAISSWIVLPNESPDGAAITGMFFVGVSILGYNYLNGKEKKALKIASDLDGTKHQKDQ